MEEGWYRVSTDEGTRECPFALLRAHRSPVGNYGYENATCGDWCEFYRNETTPDPHGPRETHCGLLGSVWNIEWMMRDE
jgi:hypothetical protein